MTTCKGVPMTWAEPRRSYARLVARGLSEPDFALAEVDQTVAEIWA